MHPDQTMPSPFERLGDKLGDALEEKLGDVPDDAPPPQPGESLGDRIAEKLESRKDADPPAPPRPKTVESSAREKWRYTGVGNVEDFLEEEGGDVEDVPAVRAVSERNTATPAPAPTAQQPQPQPQQTQPQQQQPQPQQPQPEPSVDFDQDFEPDPAVGGHAEQAAVPTPPSTPAKAKKASFSQLKLLYESRDGLLCLFEDADGHYVAARASKLA